MCISFLPLSQIKVIYKASAIPIIAQTKTDPNPKIIVLAITLILFSFERYFVIEKELTKEEYPELKQNIPMYYVLHFTYEVDKENENKIQNAKLMNDYYFQSKEKSNKNNRKISCTKTYNIF